MLSKRKRKWYWRGAWLALLLLPTALPSGAAVGHAQTRQRPNILWITTDQQRWDTIRALGNKHIRTPNLDRLVAEGVAFERAYVQGTVCTPSRASMLTGYYPSTLHVNRNGNAYFPKALTRRLISRILADAGYDAGHIGKFHLSSAPGRVEPRLDDGYRLFQWNHHPMPEAAWPPEHNAYQRWLQEQGVEWGKVYRAERLADWPDAYQPGMPSKYHQTTWAANEAIKFISEQRAAPWLLTVNPFDPHPAFDPPAEYLRRMNVASMPLPLFHPEDLRTQRALSEVDHQTSKPQAPDAYPARHMIAAYYAEIELIDDQLGRVLRALEATGQRANTLIIFTSDHGEMLGDHGLLHKGCRFYEGAVRVPLLVSWPARCKAGVRSRALVELTDIVPTLLETTGQAAPNDLPGKSLLPILTGQADPAQHRPYVRTEYYDALQLPGFRGTHATMFVDGRYKLVVYHGLALGELYDLQPDPHEFRNLWNDPRGQAVKLRLMKQSFDATMLATDLGQPRVGRY